jgi:hypothetical protein
MSDIALADDGPGDGVPYPFRRDELRANRSGVDDGEMCPAYQYLARRFVVLVQR